MKKEITVKLEYEFDEQEDTDELIKEDLQTEISSCWHLFDIVGIEIKEQP